MHIIKKNDHKSRRVIKSLHTLTLTTPYRLVLNSKWFQMDSIENIVGR
jgi:hypothetical protein